MLILLGVDGSAKDKNEIDRAEIKVNKVKMWKELKSNGFFIKV